MAQVSPKSLSSLLAVLLLLGPAISAVQADPPAAPNLPWSEVVESGQRALLQSNSAGPSSALTVAHFALQTTESEPASSAAPVSNSGMSQGKKALLIAVIAAASTIAIYAALENKTLR